MSQEIIYTIGHSNHAPEVFIGLLEKHGISAIADVRSAPSSKFAPHFAKDALKALLKEHGIEYVFLGRELGGRPDDPSYFTEEGGADYKRMAKRPIFQEGLERVRQGSRKHKIALMCSEKNPLDCHRTLLVGQALFHEGFFVNHILADGKLKKHQDIIDGMMKTKNDLFLDKKTLELDAVHQRSTKVSYRRHKEKVGAAK